MAQLISTIAKGTRFKGEIISSGDVEIIGEYEGDINAKTITIAEDGHANGFYDCDTFIVNPKGKAEGEVHTTNICMTSRSVFDGTIKMKGRNK